MHGRLIFSAIRYSQFSQLDVTLYIYRLRFYPVFEVVYSLNPTQIFKFYLDRVPNLALPILLITVTTYNSLKCTSILMICICVSIISTRVMKWLKSR